MRKNLTIPFHKLIVVMVTPDLLPEVNKTLGYYLKVSALTNSEHQLLDRVKERQLIEEEIANHPQLYQELLAEILTQRMTMMIMIITKRKLMAGEGEADIRNARLEDHDFHEIFLPVLGKSLNLCRVLVLLSDRQNTQRNLTSFFKGKITKRLEIG